MSFYISDSAYRFVEYHSAAWDVLVETGWTTITVDPLPNGMRIAKMGRR